MKTVLFIFPEIPYPLDKRDKLRAFHHLKCLNQKSNVHAICLSEEEPSEEALSKLSKHSKSLSYFILPKNKRWWKRVFAFFNGLPLSVAEAYSSKFKKEIEKKILEINPSIIHCHTIETAFYSASFPEIPKSIDFMNSQSLKHLKKIQLIKNPISKLLTWIEYRRIKRFEYKTLNVFDQAFVIGKSDRNGFSVKHQDQLEILPNGVNMHFFQAKEVEKQYDLLMTGNLDEYRNDWSINYLKEDVMPLLPSYFKVLIADIGNNSKSTQSFGEQFTIENKFKNLREAYWVSKYLIVPVFNEFGFQNKILQAMAMKVPVICSSLANSYINAEHEVSILIADTPAEYAQAIMHLSADEEFAGKIAQQAFDFVKKNYDWPTVNRSFVLSLVE